MKLALLLVLIPAVAHADVIDEKGVHVGTVFTGLSLPAAEEMSGGVKPDFGLDVGSFATLRVATSFSVQLEAQLELQRFKDKMNSEIVGSFEIWAFELPVLARLDAIPGDRKLYVVAGPSVVLSAGGKTTSDGMVGPITSTVEGIKPINFAITAGVGFELPAGPGRVTFDARYRRLLLPFTDGDNSLSAGKPTQDHMIMGFVGYAFP